MTRASTAAHDRVIASVNRPEAGPGPDHRYVGHGATAAFATMFHEAWITRPDRPDLSDVRSSLLPDVPAPAIFMAMQGDHAS
jgi:hypothetical protein